MKPGIIIVCMLITVSFVQAALDWETAQVTLYAPLEGAVITSPSQDFIFEVTAPENASTCSLLVNDEWVKNYTSISPRTAKKFSVTLSDGEYVWSISCLLANGQNINSLARNLTINASAKTSSCASKIYKGQGAYRYVFTNGCIQQGEVTLTEVRAGDWLEYQITETAKLVPRKSNSTLFDVYLVKLSQKNERDYIQFFTNKDKTRIDLYAKDSIALDINGDTVEDLNLTLEAVTLKKARIVIRSLHSQTAQTPEIPDDQVVPPPEVITPDTPPETAPDTTPTTDVQPPQENTPDETQTEPADNTDNVAQAKDPTKFWVTIGIIIILVIIVGYLIVSNKKEKKKQSREERKESRDEKQKPEAKKSQKPDLPREEARRREHDDFMIEGKKKR